MMSSDVLGIWNIFIFGCVAGWPFILHFHLRLPVIHQAVFLVATDNGVRPNRETTPVVLIFLEVETTTVRPSPVSEKKSGVCWACVKEIWYVARTCFCNEREWPILFLYYKDLHRTRYGCILITVFSSPEMLLHRWVGYLPHYSFKEFSWLGIIWLFENVFNQHM